MTLRESSIFFQNTRYRYYYLCPYLPLGIGIDPVSRSLLKFKRGKQPDLNDWIEHAWQGLREIVPAPPPDTIIIRALHHNETRPDPNHPTPLDLLGQTLSTHLYFPYKPGLLLKTRPTSINQSLTRPQREAELRDVYAINPSALENPLTSPATSNQSVLQNPVADPSSPETTLPTPTAPNQQSPEKATAPLTPSSILLLDDILTTGATALVILKTLKAAFPACTITIFTLAKAE
jgi:predicted amidophosphoribosyltransferase